MLLTLHGIQHGARVLYHGPATGQDSTNLPSALQQSAAVSADLHKEVKAGRMAGPLATPPAAPFKVSPIGTVPKNGTDEHRRIHHLSYPEGDSVNDYIDDIKLEYASFEVSNAPPSYVPISSLQR